MSGWHITGDERRKPPREYEQHLTDIGGLNRFGEPNFIIVWGQTQTQTIYGDMAGVGRGQHVILQFGGVPAWHIMEWKPPETFGTPQMWYTLTWDVESDKHALGEYPWRGLYVPCSFNLYVRKVIGGGVEYDRKTGQVIEKPSRLEVDAMPLAHWVLDLLIPNVRKARELTHFQKKLAIEMRMEAEKKERLRLGYDAYLNAQPAFGGEAGTYESNREAWMQRLREKAAGMKLSGEDVRKVLGTGHTQISGRLRRN